MRRISTIGLSAVMAVMLVACNDDGDSVGEGVGGTWNGTGSYVYHSVPITQFNLNLSQAENAVSGTYAIKREVRDLMSGTVSGSVSGDRISLTMIPHGSAEGTVSGDTMNLEWVETGFGGTDWTGPHNAYVTLTR